MKKLLKLLDDNLLRFGVAFAILFTALYPKLPSVHVPHTWVYVRLEDFLILFLVFICLIQLLRRKIALPRPEGYALVIYWIVGAISLVYCIAFVIPGLPIEFFPSIAWLEFLRRIEYMILFFVAFSTVRNQRDVRFYLTTLAITLSLIICYGFGQKFYPLIWNFFPEFFKHHQFCFPAFLTGNEEFAKGTPLCLDSLSRISSTFGGHYDLAAYLVLVIPIFIALFIVVRRWYIKIPFAILVVLGLELLNFTSSRTSFAAYVLGAISMLILWKKKLWIIPVLLASIGILFFLSNATLQRFAKTIQPVQVVQIQPGSTTSDQDIQKIISTTQQKNANKKPQTPAPGTVTIGNDSSLASGSSQVLTAEDLASLQANGSISTVSGSFLLKKAYALDISSTTRFQAEWPRDWNAFLYSPVFGTGYSSLTLASDNDYLRALGETGLAGFLAFLFIFVIFGIFLKEVAHSVEDRVTQAFLFGLAGGVIGLLINAVLIDVFEASKVAEPLWILLGIALGAAKLYHKKAINYKKELLIFLTSNTLIIIYLFVLVFTIFGSSINNFFVADDYSWLKWAATAVPSDLMKYFVYLPDFFYRPLDKIIVYFLYTIFSFLPQGYHIFILLLHFVTSVGVFFLAKKISRSKLIGTLTAVLFVLLPAHTENVFWFSTISVELGALFIIFMMLTYIKFRENNSIVGYILAILFAALAFVTYEIAVITPLILMTLDIFILKPKRNIRIVYSYIPFVILLVLYFVMRFVSHAFSGGGDYSYHLSRFIPNMIGNFLGYTGMYLGGPSFLSFYNTVRDSLRSDWIFVSFVILVIIGLLMWAIYTYRRSAKAMIHNKDIHIILFCIVFAFISLLPFLPLGNIAPRYLYLASAGYTLALVSILKLLFIHWLKQPKYVTSLLIVVTIGLSFISIVNLRQEQNKWENAGYITQNTLLFFRKNYAGLGQETNLYFVNTPVQENGVWVFPVGLNDGLWIIYRDKLPHVVQVNSLEDAMTAANSGNTDNNYIFDFDKNGSIQQVR
ncbi:MAG: O-antigen ligase family protein [Candidatus Levyibacteriota bacterium]